MNPETGVLDNMDMGKGYDDNDWLHRSSLSQHLM